MSLTGFSPMSPGKSPLYGSPFDPKSSNPQVGAPQFMGSPGSGTYTSGPTSNAPYGPINPSNLSSDFINSLKSPQSIYNQLYQQNAGLFGNYDDLRSQMQFKQSLLAQQYGAQAGGMSSQAGIAQQKNDLNLQGNAIDQAAAQRLPGYYTGLNDSNNAYYTNLNNANQGNLQAQYDMYGNLITNAGQQRDIQAAQSKLGAGKSTREMRSVAAAGGAMSSAGVGSQYGEIQGTLANQLALGQNAYEQSRDIYGKRQLSLQKEMEGGNLTTQHEIDKGNMTTAEQVAQAKDTQAKLELVAQQYGLDAQSIAAGLSSGLASLGIANKISMNDLMTAMTSNDRDQQMAAMQLYNQAMNAAAGSGYQIPGTLPVSGSIYSPPGANYGNGPAFAGNSPPTAPSASNNNSYVPPGGYLPGGFSNQPLNTLGGIPASTSSSKSKSTGKGPK